MTKPSDQHWVSKTVPSIMAQSLPWDNQTGDKKNIADKNISMADLAKKDEPNLKVWGGAVTSDKSVVTLQWV